MYTSLPRLLCTLSIVLACACTPTAQRAPTGPQTYTPPTSRALTADESQFLEGYTEVLNTSKTFTADTFDTTYPPPKHLETLSFDPNDADNLDIILKRYKPTPQEQSLLQRNGFVALGPKHTQTHGQIYASIYHGHLPVFISTDSILYALHRSYDSALLDLEINVLRPELTAMLEKMHSHLQATSKQLPQPLEGAAQDTDVYLTVARNLLNNHPPQSVYPTTSNQANTVLANIEKLQPKPLSMFGTQATYDYSQLKPRGHYTLARDLTSYFQAMMWIGRTEARMVEYKGGEPVFNRKAFESAYLLNHLLEASDARKHWDTINLVISWMVGEHDSMTPPQMTEFATQLQLPPKPNTSLRQLTQTNDADLKSALLSSNLGTQRIMSQIICSDPHDPKSVQLARSFQLMGQRFTIDAHVFQHVTYDRLKDPQTGAKIPRVVPSPLDALFALGSNTAGQLLRKERETYNYSHALHTTRSLVEAHPSAFWEGSLYNSWLQALQALDDHTNRSKLPETFRTQPWDHKTLNTQLASWSELKHDTLLYAKQSYGASILCEYPDAYVEPNPFFFTKMGKLAANGLAMTQKLKARGLRVERLERYFTHFSETMQTLHTIARKEIERSPLTQKETNFLKATIEREMVGCGTVSYDGWYPGLFFSRGDVGKYKPTVADIHTAPSDRSGNPVGWVLHAATGPARPMIVTVDHGDGTSHAYVGPASTYYEHTTNQFARLTNEEWASMLSSKKTPIALPAWTRSFSGEAQKK